MGEDSPRAAQASAGKLAVRLFGPFEVRLNGRPLPRLRSRRGEWLLALLVLRHGAEVDRSWLAGLLWPDSSELQALANLRISLADLRRALGPEAERLRSPSPRTLSLDLDEAEADLVTFDALVTSGEEAALQQAVALYRAPLLEGCLEEWAFEEREARRQAYLQALERLAAMAMERRQPEAAERHLRRVIAVDPAREPAQRALMRALAASGSYAAAVQVYRELRVYLHREVNAEPDAETRAVFDELRAEARGKAVVSGQWPLATGVKDASALEDRLASGHWPLATATVTFLFIDIAGSLRLWEEQPDTIRLALERHQAFLRSAIEMNGGLLFQSRGDALCAAFEAPTDALDAVLTAQRQLRGLQPSAVTAVARLSLEVRMALHTGVAERRGSDYFGPALQRAARLLEVGHGGQVLLSAATRELVQDDLPPAASMRDLGQHRLRDLERAERIYQLLHPDLPAEFPPLFSLELLPNNLPQPVTRFIGREQEMAVVKELLGKTRLLTLTGAGGCGKTRLALQVAADLLTEYPDGVYLVELASLADPALVPQTVAAALGVREEPGRPLAAIVADYLRPKRLLLLLDNCEHLLAACGQMAESWLRSCPALVILATSREVLGIAGETTYRVPSLSLLRQVDGSWLMVDGPARTGSFGPSPPPASRVPDHPPSALLESEAVRLFLDRASAALPSFALTEQNAPAIAQVCRRLDGIPLAIELAAARVQALPVETIAERLDDRFHLLMGVSRTAPARQQTLAALIDWSYDLLSPEERVLLHRLSVFAGGWTLEAAEAVVSGQWFVDGGQDPVTDDSGSGSAGPTTNHYPLSTDVLDLLTRLVSKSLVIYEATEPGGPAGGKARYRLLEIVRQYSRDRLEEAGEAVWMRERHRDFFLALVEQAEPELWGPTPREWMDRLEAEHDNVRAALGRSVENEEAAAALRLAGALTRFWDIRRHISEGRAWLARVLSLAGTSEHDALRAKALFRAGVFAQRQDDNPAAQAFWAESLAIRRQLGDRRGIAEVINASVNLVPVQENPATWALLEESLAICRELEDRRGIARALWGMGSVAAQRGDCAPARAWYEEALALYRGINDRIQEAATLRDLGHVADLEGEDAAARAFYEQSLTIYRELEDPWGTSHTLFLLGKVAFCQGDSATAQAAWEETLALDRAKMGCGGYVCYSLGWLAAERGDFAAARALYEELLAERRTSGLHRAHGLMALGELAHVEGDLTAAQGYHTQGLALFRELQADKDVAIWLGLIAGLRNAQGRPEQAARLFGAAEALREALRPPVTGIFRAKLQRDVSATRAAMAEPAFAAAWAAGRQMSLDEAVSFAQCGASNEAG
jgi:predicted ATPase/DNA-binding SARP family transcriptional activator/class 3 adenylate cyclase